jgi:hypothetical protein
MKQPDQITTNLIIKLAGSGISTEDLMRLQRKWGRLAKEARHPFAFCGSTQRRIPSGRRRPAPYP